MSSVEHFLSEMLGALLSETSRAWLAEAEASVALLGPGPGTRFPTLLSQASRHIPRGNLSPAADARGRAHELLEGWNPERWTLLDAARAVLVLARRDLATSAGVGALEDCFTYADVGELCSLHRAVCLLPDPGRFSARAGEGCRSSMRVVYEAAACDTPLPVRHFDDIAWRQLAIKAVFVGAPLWRVYGLDTRLDAELARMALDLVEERRAAGRRIQPELWLCLGRFGGERGQASLERELAVDWAPGRAASALALARAGGLELVRAAYDRETDPLARATMESALRGRIHQGAWSELHGLE